jgi:hypothetical protein
MAEPPDTKFPMFTEPDLSVRHASVIFDEGGPRYEAICARAAAMADAWKQSLGDSISYLHCSEPIILRVPSQTAPSAEAPDPQDKKE